MQGEGVSGERGEEEKGRRGLDAAVVLCVYLHFALLFVFRLHKFNFCSFHFAALF